MAFPYPFVIQHNSFIRLHQNSHEYLSSNKPSINYRRTLKPSLACQASSCGGGEREARRDAKPHLASVYARIQRFNNQIEFKLFLNGFQGMLKWGVTLPNGIVSKKLITKTATNKKDTIFHTIDLNIMLEPTSSLMHGNVKHIVCLFMCI